MPGLEAFVKTKSGKPLPPAPKPTLPLVPPPPDPSPTADRKKHLRCANKKCKFERTLYKLTLSAEDRICPKCHHPMLPKKGVKRSADQPAEEEEAEE
jgi:hypothetical protein